jgi:hypothetical protein
LAQSAKDFLWKQGESGNSGGAILVINGYSVRGDLSNQKDSVGMIVDYGILGRIGPSLDFTSLQASFTNQPKAQSERFSLILTDTHFELDRNGRLQPIKGIPEWRIKTEPQNPHVSVMAAMSYVRGASYRSKDPLLKARAQQTLAALDLLAQSSFMPVSMTGPSEGMPEGALSQFIQMQMDGAGLAAGDSGQLDIFLVRPAQFRQDKIGVARNFGIRRTALAVNKAEAFVQYDAIGEVDLQLRFTTPSANGNTVRQDYKLIFDNDYSSASAGSGAPSHVIGPSRWRIEEAPPQQWVSVATAIKYATQMRDATRDPAIRENADKTLATLSRYR